MNTVSSVARGRPEADCDSCRTRPSTSAVIGAASTGAATA
jgi:hypothetical protein